MTRHIAVVGLGFGDEGKGTIVDWLCSTRRVSAVVRFNGGAQAGHNVVLPDGRHHTFSQWGAGTFHGVPTLFSRFTLFDPLAAVKEGKHLVDVGLNNPWDLLYVDEDALVVTPYHVLVNRAREMARGDQRHGSVGMGIGETMAHSIEFPDDVLRARDLLSERITFAKLAVIYDWAATSLALQDTDVTVDDVLLPPSPLARGFSEIGQRLVQVVPAHVADSFLTKECVFEGAQGVLLDEGWGLHPYTTWSTCTPANAIALAQGNEVYGLGVLRTYTTRHGAGPLVSEDTELADMLTEPHNVTGDWQGAWRAGHFDAVAHRYALEVCGGDIHGLALTHVDVADAQELRVCSQWEVEGKHIDRLPVGQRGDLDYQSFLATVAQWAKPKVDELSAGPGAWPLLVQKMFGLPVTVASYGPTSADKKVLATF